MGYDATSAYLQSKGRKVAIRLPHSPPCPGKNPRQILVAEKAVYGLRDSARNWYHHLRTVLLSFDWCESAYEPGVFFLRRKKVLVAVIYTYVDDLAVIADMRVPQLGEDIDKVMKAVMAKKSEVQAHGIKFLGRWISIDEVGLHVSMQCKMDMPVEIEGEPERALSRSEERDYRSMLGSLLWFS
eukprot:3752453-Amphidinium_carterae.1